MNIGYIHEKALRPDEIFCAPQQLLALGCDKIFFDFVNKESFAPMWHSLLSSLRAGDTLYILYGSNQCLDMESFCKSCIRFDIEVKFITYSESTGISSPQAIFLTQKNSDSHTDSLSRIEKKATYMRAANLALWGMPPDKISKKLGLDKRQVYRIASTLGIKGALLPL